MEEGQPLEWQYLRYAAVDPLTIEWPFGQRLRTVRTQKCTKPILRNTPPVNLRALEPAKLAELR